MKQLESIGAQGGAQLAGQGEHGALWRVISDLLVTRLGTCMLVRSLVLENRWVLTDKTGRRGDVRGVSSLLSWMRDTFATHISRCIV